MKFSHKTRGIKILLFLGIVGIIGVSITAYLYHRKPVELKKDLRSSSKLAYGRGISFVEYHGDKKVYSVSIDSFSIERARIGPFAIGPLHIAHLNKVAIDVYEEGIESRLDEKFEEKTTKGDLLDLQNPISSIRKNLPSQMKKVKGIELKDISLNLWKNEKRIFRISSDTANVDRKTGDIVFTGHANMDAGKNGKVLSHRIRWDRKTHFFKILGSYYLIRDGKQIEGKGIETDYLLKKISYIASAK